MGEAKDIPAIKLFLRTKQGLECLVGPNLSSNDMEVPTSIEFETDTSFTEFSGASKIQQPPIFSADGALMCILREPGLPIHIVDSNSGSLIGDIPCLDAQFVEWSPMGTFVTTWSRPLKTGQSNGSDCDGNFRVWSATSLSLVAHYHQRTFKKNLIQWSADETMCFRLVSNELHVSDGRDLARGILNKIHQKSVTQFRISVTSPSVSVALFTPEMSGNPARCALYRVGSGTEAPEGPISSRTMFSASEANLMWNKQGTALLVHTQSDVDSSNLSYYGATGLFIMTADGKVSAIVPQTKEGPTHDVCWSPLGDTFVVVAGNMPCNSTLYSVKGEPVYEFGSAHRNTISFSPHGRFMVLAGFGNLAGEMDFYDMRRRKRIGSTSAHCTVSFGWSPCSRLFMTATLAPRMNVDNGIKVYTCEGVGPVYSVRRDVCYDALWRPASSGLFPDKGPNRKPAGSQTDVKNAPSLPAPPAKPAAYRPPGSSGALSGLIRRERESGGSSAGKPGSGTGPGKKPSPQHSLTQPQRVIPGLAPVPGKEATQKSKTKKEKKPTAPVSIAVTPPPPPPSSSFAAAAAAINASVSETQDTKIKANSGKKQNDSAVKVINNSEKESNADKDNEKEKEKRIKNAKKKLKGVQELRARVTAGLSPNADQLAKLETEITLVKELCELGCKEPF